MAQLYITQIKPNPKGRDRLGSSVPNQQLAAEWVDIKNIGSQSIPLQSVVLQHVAFTSAYPNGVWTTAYDFSNATGALGIGETVRIHSGGKINLDLMYSEDRQGADYHLFTGNGYIWNNSRSDSPRLVKSINGVKTELDRATYVTRPPEGRILIRSGNELR